MRIARAAAAVLAAICGCGPVQADGAASALTEAWYEAPSDVYPHRIMGKIREKLVLAARDASGMEYRVDLRAAGPDHNVFEDIAPRLVDADGDGVLDIVAVESARSQGAQLAIYSLRRGALVKSAATPHIGTRFRWLAPVAIADLDGDGTIELAYVDRPHLARTLRVWSWAAGGLVEVARMPGLTNHRIGDEVIWGGLRDCEEGRQMVLADAGFGRVVLVGFDRGRLRRTNTDLAASPEGFATALAC